MLSASVNSPDGDSAETARSQVQWLAGLAEFHREQGNYRDAETLFKQALAIAEDAFGSDALEVSVILNNFAVLYKFMARFSKARQFYIRSLAITEKRQGRDGQRRFWG
jgi:tetratricopeptide (TPR) repeat protein